MMNRKMIKQAQELQKNMARMQEELEASTVEGTSGGGMVKIIMNCKNEVKKIDIDPSIIKNDEKCRGNARNTFKYRSYSCSS